MNEMDLADDVSPPIIISSNLFRLELQIYGAMLVPKYCIDSLS